MIGAGLIVVGYATVIVSFGWTGVLACAAHGAVLLWGMRRG